VAGRLFLLKVPTFHAKPLQRSPTITQVILGTLLGWALVLQIIASLSWGHESWQITEWLINYSGGFVRRGLAGTVFWYLSELTGIQANHLAIVASLICYAVLNAWLLRNATRWFPAILVLSCVAMGFPAYQDSIVRKDCLGLLLLIACIKAWNSRQALGSRILLTNFFACTAILIHETFVFYAFPALLLHVMPGDTRRNTKGFLHRLVALTPSMVCFGLTVIHHGSPAIARTIHESWLPLWRTIDGSSPPPDTPSAAIRAIGWSASEGMELTLYMFRSGWYQPTAWAIVFSISFVLVLLFTRSRSSPTGASAIIRTRVLSILVFQLICISPLFLLGIDYGRWLFFWIVSSMIFLACGLRPPAIVTRSLIRAPGFRSTGILLGKLPVREWYLLFFGVPVCWNIHNFLIASPVVRHLHMLWTAS
jgi:hypothetical protein